MNTLTDIVFTTASEAAAYRARYSRDLVVDLESDDTTKAAAYVAGWRDHGDAEPRCYVAAGAVASGRVACGRCTKEWEHPADNDGFLLSPCDLEECEPHSNANPDPWAEYWWAQG